jgi:hypothetical protein
MLAKFWTLVACTSFDFCRSGNSGEYDGSASGPPSMSSSGPAPLLLFLPLNHPILDYCDCMAALQQLLRNPVDDCCVCMCRNARTCAPNNAPFQSASITAPSHTSRSRPCNATPSTRPEAFHGSIVMSLVRQGCTLPVPVRGGGTHLEKPENKLDAMHSLIGAWWSAATEACVNAVGRNVPRVDANVRTGPGAAQPFPQVYTTYATHARHIGLMERWQGNQVGIFGANQPLVLLRHSTHSPD